MLIHIVKFKFITNLLCWLLLLGIVMCSILSTALVPIVGFMLIYVAVFKSTNVFQVIVLFILGAFLVLIGVEPLIETTRKGLVRTLAKWNVFL